MKIKKSLLPIIIIILAIIIACYFLMNKKKINILKKESPIIKVNTQLIKKSTHPIIVEGYGLIQASQETTITPQVKGKIVYINPRLNIGTQFKKGDILARIEQADYQKAISQENAHVQKATLELIQEEAKKIVAKKEWDLLNKHSQESITNKELTLRTIFVENAHAKLIATQSSLEIAKLNLERTNIRAPYNGYIMNKNFEIGDIINNNNNIMTFANLDLLEVQANISKDFLKYFPNSIKQYKAFIYDKEVKMINIIPQLNKNSKQATILVNFKNQKNKTLIEDFVKVKFFAQEIDSAFRIPFSALRNNNTLWIKKDNRLKIIDCLVIIKQGNSIIVRLTDFSINQITLIDSYINSAYNGMIITE